VSGFSILTTEVIDGATLFASTEDVGTPVSNLLLNQPRDVWKTTNDSIEYVEVDFGSAKEFDQVYLGFTNLTLSTIARIRAADTQGNLTAAPGYDSNDFPAFPQPSSLPRSHIFFPLNNPETYRWVRIEFRDPSNPDGFITAGRIIIGKSFQPGDNININVPLTFGALDRSPSITRRDGGTEIDKRPKINSFRGSIETKGPVSSGDEDEFMDNLDEIMRNQAGSDPILFVIEPNNATHRQKRLFYGIVESTLPLIKLATSSAKRYRLPINVREMI